MSFKTSGQSLVEFIIITPIFFTILSGIVSLFFLQNRNFIDLEANFSLSYSQFLFSNAERLAAKWEQNLKNSNQIFKDELDLSLNSSKAFFLATDKKNQVFIDKNPVIYSKNDICNSKNTYTVNSQKEGTFTLSTCTEKNGYEKAHFSFQTLLERLSVIRKNGSSIFYPFKNLSWDKRALLVRNDVNNLLFSTKNAYISKNFASLLFPNDHSYFNGKCFMEPFNPQCPLHPYGKKMERAAIDGSNLQLASCYTELVIKCATLKAGAPVCIAEGVKEIKLSVSLGVQAKSCFILNQEIEGLYTFIKARAFMERTKNTVVEMSIRKK